MSKLPKVKLVAVAKDEAPYLPYWVFHHLHFGFDEIEVYINRTSDNSESILKLISETYNNVKFHNSDWIDKLPSPSRKNLQHISYMQGINSSSCDYVMLLDIDEFWVNKDFKTTISEFILQSKNFDVMVFEWLNETNASKPLAPFNKKVKGKLDHLGKCIIKSQDKIHTIRLHVPEMKDNANVILANGDKFQSQKGLPQHIHNSINNLKDAFIIHRMFRTESEYLASLFRGNPEQDFPIKLNRNGFGYPNNEKLTSVDFDTNLYNAYLNKFEQFLKECNIPDLTSTLLNIQRNVESLKKSLPNLHKVKPKAVERVLDRVEDAEIRKLIGNTESEKNTQNITVSNKINIPSTKKRKIIIHAGAHKTGTTSIQNTFFRNKDILLSKYNVLYPVFSCGRANHSVTIYDACLANTSSQHNIRKLNAEQLESSKRNLIRDFSKFSNLNNWDNLVISAESLSNMSKEMLSNFKEILDTSFGSSIEYELVFFVRHPYDYYKSSFQERLKIESSDKILSNGFPNSGEFQSSIIKLESVFGKDRLKILTFEEAIKYNKGVFHYFIDSFLNGKPSINEKDLRKDSKSNTSMSIEVSEFVDYIHKQDLVQTSTLSISMMNELKPILDINYINKFELSESISEKAKRASITDIDYLKKRFNIIYSLEREINRKPTWTKDNILHISRAAATLPRFWQKIFISFLNNKKQQQNLPVESVDAIEESILIMTSRKNYLKSCLRDVIYSSNALTKIYKAVR
ncbi:glycosyltransferase family 2 protein [Vibrio natriegens]